MKDKKALEKLFRLLNRRMLSRELKDQFISFGTDAYYYLESRIESSDATDLQVVNSLKIMCDWKFWLAIDRSRVFTLLAKFSKDPRKTVRSIAIGIIVSWTHWAELDPKAYRIPESQRYLVKPLAEDALALGLEENYARLVKSFIAGEF